ncbi:MAG: hypothetical protein J6J26_04680 [Bacteroides sp.]|nr:hypothetical protein [Bacteroides sp.]
MKSKFLFSTLVMAAAFSACTQEDIAVNNENASMEVVGAKLLGSGFTVDPSNGLDSRVTVENGVASWSGGDKAGVAWAIHDKVADTQDSLKGGSLYNNIYANHMLVYSIEEGFTSRSNVYGGWHFSYTPYKYMAKPQQLGMVVNPPLEIKDLAIDQYLNAPQVSNRAFLDEEDVDAETGKVKVSFPLQWITNTIKPNLNVSSAFTEDDTLSTLAIQSITLNVGEGNDIFTNSFKVVPAKLGVVGIKNGKDSVIIDESYYGNAFVADSKDSTVTTVITEKGQEIYTLANAKNVLRMYLAPTETTTIDTTDISFKIDVEGGYFTVAYDKTKEKTEANNKAIIEMWDMLTSGLKVTDAVTINLTKANQATKNLQMSLGIDNFTADYTISDYDEWKAAVKIANALAQDGVKPTFVLEAGKEIVFPAGEILVPTNGVNVSTTNGNIGAKMAFADSTVWNEKIGTVGGGAGLLVKDGGSLTVNKSVAATNFTVEAGGVIYAGAKASLNTHNGNGVVNKGRIVVEYGANLKLKEVGTVAYVVTGKETIAQIEALIATSGNTSGRHAQVNTFVINEGIEWDMLKTETIDGSEDVYNPSDDETPGYTAGVLNNISFEINGGEVYAAEDEVVSVKNVTMNGGELKYVNLTGTLTIEGDANTVVNESVTGAATIKGGETTITGTTFGSNVTVEAGSVTMNNVDITGNLTNKGTVTIAGEATEIANIVNDGTLNANTDIVVETIAVNLNATANVATGKTIWYTVPQAQGGYVQEGTTKGRILYYGAAQLANAITEGGDVTLMSTVELPTTQEISNEVSIDLNGNDIIATTPYDASQDMVSAILVKDGAKLTIDGEGSISGGASNKFNIAVRANAGEVTIKNGKFYVGKDDASSTDQQVIYATGTSIITIEGGEFMVVDENGDPITSSLKYLLNQKDADRSTSKIIVKGGTFYGFNPADNTAEGANTNFVADGYVSKETSTGSNIWVVTKQ